MVSISLYGVSIFLSIIFSNFLYYGLNLPLFYGFNLSKFYSSLFARIPSQPLFTSLPYSPLMNVIHLQNEGSLEVEDVDIEGCVLVVAEVVLLMQEPG